ncbi:hypothetical protein NDU88_004934 [Pleurodeles waltl]|uniref:Uncharacterized protein n=1 Tax=Pleurodeles waltl TaxID=8319 RepID=A0AAV7W9M1_PLEWA|nr:hypothetical protein NDU88_004934 [Pleurodeles waltl]
MKLKTNADSSYSISWAPGRQAIPSGDQGEKGYPGGTAGDNPEEEDGGNLEIRVPSETKDGLPRRPTSVEEDTEEEERRRRTPATYGGSERQCRGGGHNDEGQGGREHSLTAMPLDGRGSGRYGPEYETGTKYKALVGREEVAGGGEEKGGRDGERPQ